MSAILEELKSPAVAESQPGRRRKIRFCRNEWSGAFGDIGTDLPLLAGMILATGVNPANVFILFGMMQIFSALVYRIPMPAQPLKLVAVIVIAQQTPPELIWGAGLVVGVGMLLLTVTGLLDLIARVVPKPVVRGIQLGLGLNLAYVALASYLPAEGVPGYFLAAGGIILVLVLLGNRRWPASLAVLGLGFVYAFIFKHDMIFANGGATWSLPVPSLPPWAAIAQGAVLLALPQIPLSIGNSVLATRQIARDHFPEAGVTIRKIGVSYSIMNFVSAPLGGVPVCHGSGGMAGHYAFGGRTGGSVIIYGVFMACLGLAFGSGFDGIIELFPLPVLGVILGVEAIALMRLLRDQAFAVHALGIALLVGAVAFALPHGFLIGIVGGTVLYWLMTRWQRSAARGGHTGTD